MKAGFIALLNVAVTIVLIQAPLDPLKGATDVTVGAVRVGLPPVLSGSLHPIVTTRSRNAVKLIVSVRYLRMAITLLFRCSAEASPVSRNAIG
jgi:hypothetical protein